MCKLKKDLDNNLFPNTYLTSRDLENGERLYGPCPGCVEGKMKAPSEPTSTSPPATTIGERLHADLKELPEKTIGGNNQMLIVVDEKSSMTMIVLLPSKKKEALCGAWDQVIAAYNASGHTVKQVTTDHEITLISCRTHLGGRGVRLTTHPAGLHEKRVERKIQELGNHVRSIKASLSYELPARLEGELWSHAAHFLNMQSTEGTRPSCPLKIFTGNNPFLSKYYFGQVGLFHTRRPDERNLRAEWGIFVGYGDTPKSLRAFIPTKFEV